MANRSSKARRPARGFSNPLHQMSKDMRKAVAESLRSATRKVISELQEQGPNYSGQFKAKWFSQAEGRGNKVFASVGVPRFTDEQLKKGTPAILIGNSAPYAQEAMDLMPGIFRSQAQDPNKEPVAVGKRVGRMRGQVRDLPSSDIEDIVKNGRKPSFSTAEPNWFTTYMEGGGFDKAFKQGAKTGFISVARK